MRISTFLHDSETKSLDFSPEILGCLDSSLPDLNFSHHFSESSFLTDTEKTEVVITWRFEEPWYQKFPQLKTVYTPAAGHDWVKRDPSGKVVIIHGAFIQAAIAAFAGASFARCSRSFVTPRYGFGAAIRGVDAIDRYDAIRDLCKLLNVGGVYVARRKRSAPAKHRKAVPKVPPKVLTALISDCMPWLKPLAH